MNDTSAVNALGALAQEHRLKAFRLLVTRGPSGLPAGDIAEALGIARNALSFHLSQLEHAGLVHSWRQGRQIFYAVNVEGMRGLLTFLTEDCCSGRPELCGGVMALAEACVPDGTK